jgi:hypothetical protein
MDVNQIIFRQPISAIWQALGGDAPRRGRAPAFYRKGDNPGSVSLNDEKGCWHDFVTGNGGGVLDLVQLVRGGSRREAIRWLSELVGVPIEVRPLRDRKSYAVRRAAVQLEATQLARNARDWEHGLELLLLHREKIASEITAWFQSQGLDAGNLLIKARNDLAVLRQAEADSLIQAYCEMSEPTRCRLIESGRRDREDAERITNLIVGLLAEGERMQPDAGRT